MKKLLLLLLTVLMGLGSLTLSAQNTLTVASGTTTNSYVPVYGLYVDDFVRCQTVYPASMLTATGSMTGESILGVTYYLSTPAAASWGTANFVVNILEVPDVVLTGFVDMTNATTVYNGALDATQSTMEIEFATPYTYQGGNLLIEIYNTLEGTYKSAYFYGVEATGASWRGNDGTSVANITGSVQNFIPMTTFLYGNPPTCFKVSNLTVDATQTTDHSLTLTWTDALNTNATYSIYNMSDTSLLQGGITELTYTVDNLNANTTYYFGVQTDCGGGDIATGYAVTNSRTACGAITTLPFTEDFEAVPSGSYQMPFCWERYTSAFTTSATYPYSYSSSTYAHSGSRMLYFYGATGTAYPDTMIAVMPELDVNLYPMNGNRLTFWARTSSATIDKTVFVGTMTNPSDPATFALIDSVIVSGNTQTLYSTLLANANATDPYVALFVKKGSGTLYIDDVTLEEMPSCFEVSNVTASNITANSVTLNWVDALNSGATYTIYLANDIVGTSSDTTYTVTDLQANTQYTFGVVANCEDGNGAIMTVSVRTACDANELPFIENFDASLSSDPCWRGASVLASDVFGGTPLTQGSITGWSYQSTDNNGIPAGHYRVNIYGTTCKYWLITPLIDLSAVSSPLLSFDAAFTKFSGIALADGDISDDKFMVIISTDGGQTWDSTNAISYNLSTLNSLTYITQYVDLSNYAGDTVKIAFYGESTVSGGDNNLHLDNISIVESTGELCLPVTGLNVSNITETSATLSWIGDADSYNVYVITDTDTTMVQNVSTTTYDLTDLTAMTSYTYAVFAVCNNTESPIVTVTFSTACTAIELPYTETFETTSGTINCWTSVGDNNWEFGTGDYSTTTGAYEGSQNAKITHISTGNVTKLISPALDGVDNGMTLSFAYVMRSWSGDIDALRIYTREAADSAWQQVAEYTNAAENWTVENIIIPGTIYQVAFEHTDNYGYGLGIDSVVFGLAPDCLPVTDLTVTDASENSVTISWTGTASSYDVYNGEDFVANVTTDSYTFVGLSASTDFTFGVQAVCSPTENATMVTISASTTCGAITTYPYVQEFSSAPACWSMIDADGDGQCWILYQGAIQSASYNSVALTPDNWLISPQFAIPATGNYEVTWAATAQDQSWPAEHYGVFISTTGYADTADYTMIQEWTLGTGIFNPVIDLSAYSGQNIYIALRHFNCTDQFRLSIDEFTVRQQAGANQVTINVGQNNPAYGTVMGSGIYNIGDNVTVSATANSGYTFSKWVDETNNILSTDNPYTFVAATDLTLNAIFIDNSGTTYTITVEVNDSSMGTATGGGTYTAGEQITLVATPFSGYNFVNWTQVSSFGTNVVGTDPSLIITVTSDKTFVANFEVGSGPVPTDPTVATNAASSIAQTAATLNATITNPDNVSITAKGFEWKATTGGTYTQIAGTGTGNTFTANLTGLTPSTGYTYKAFITYNGQTVYGSEMTFTTLEQGVEPCDVPTGLTAGDITGESIAISWNASANAEGYNIQYSPQGGAISSATSTTNSYTITGLAQNTTYQIQVQANCGDGNLSGWSEPITVTTTGIENHLSNSIILYPNPAKEYVDVRIDGDINVTAMEIFDVYGKVVNTLNVTENPTRINVSGFAAGMYFVRVTTDEGTVTKTFVKR